MAYRLTPGRKISHSVTQVGTDQIDRILAKFTSKTRNGSAVHEARKAMKRLRALLHLVKPVMRNTDFRRDEARIKMIARSLSGMRDLQAMLETIGKLEVHEPPIGAGPCATAFRARLEAQRAVAEKTLNGAGAAQTRKQLKEARQAFLDIVLEDDDFAAVALTLEGDYRKARHAFHRAYRIGEDEAFHDWRKYVQRHWRQLQLVAPSWPKALRPHIALARSLSEILGEDHDLAVLAGLVLADAEHLGSRRDVDAYLDLCRRRQHQLRGMARDMGARLLAEKPSSLAARLKIYWATAPSTETDDQSGDEGDSGNVIVLAR